MGSKCAPSVACTYMGEFERNHIYNIPDNQPQPLIWLRFIDDIFSLWTHGLEQLEIFNTWLNSCHPNLKFMYTHSDTSVDFLDTTVRLVDNRLTTDLFIKPTASLSYLHRNSYRNWLRYGLRWSGWYCNPAQHELCRPSCGRLRVLCRISVPTTKAQTV